MYLSQQVERMTIPLPGAYGPHGAGICFRWKLTTWKVVRNPSGRPVWKLHHASPRCISQKAAKAYADKRLPFMSRPAAGKKVTAKEAETLTGLHAPAALDYLTEYASESPELQNYVKPAKAPKPAPEPKPKPTAADVALSKRGKAQGKVEFWQAKRDHAERMRRKWEKRAAYYTRRESTLRSAPPKPQAE